MRQDHIYVVPVPDPDGRDGVKVVRQPELEYAPLPATGGWVPRSPYWVMQLRDGSVTEAPPPQKPA